MEWYGDEKIWERERMMIEAFFNEESKWSCCFLEKTIFKGVDEDRYESKAVYSSDEEAIQSSKRGTFVTSSSIGAEGRFANRTNLVVWFWYL
jgi:hypothetical protein